MTREDHLKWCKTRALEYVGLGDLGQAVASMVSDLGKHPKTKIEPGSALGMLVSLAIQQAAQGDTNGVRRFIEGFN